VYARIYIQSTYIYVHTYIRTYMHRHTCMHAYIIIYESTDDMYKYIHTYTYTYMHAYICTHVRARTSTHTFKYPTKRQPCVFVWRLKMWICFKVATISRLLKIVGLFCKRALLKRRYSAKETYNFKEPTNRSPPRLMSHLLFADYVCLQNDVNLFV